MSYVKNKSNLMSNNKKIGKEITVDPNANNWHNS